MEENKEINNINPVESNNENTDKITISLNEYKQLLNDSFKVKNNYRGGIEINTNPVSNNQIKKPKGIFNINE